MRQLNSVLTAYVIGNASAIKTELKLNVWMQITYHYPVIIGGRFSYNKNVLMPDIKRTSELFNYMVPSHVDIYALVLIKNAFIDFALP